MEQGDDTIVEIVREIAWCMEWVGGAVPLGRPVTDYVTQGGRAWRWKR